MEPNYASHLTPIDIGQGSGMSPKQWSNLERIRVVTASLKLRRRHRMRMEQEQEALEPMSRCKVRSRSQTPSAWSLDGE